MKNYKNKEEITKDIETLTHEISRYFTKLRIIEDCCEEKRVGREFKDGSIETFCESELAYALKQISCKEAVPKERQNSSVIDRAYLTKEYLTSFRDNGKVTTTATNKNDLGK